MSLAALNASVQILALVSEAAPEGAVIERASAPAIVLERSDCLPLLVRDFGVLVRRLVVEPAFGALFVLLDHLLLALAEDCGRDFVVLDLLDPMPSAVKEGAFASMCSHASVAL